MTTFEDSRFWRETLAEQGFRDPFRVERERLRSAYRSLRDKAKDLASLIAESHPQFTIHDVTHLDALWDLAALVAGSDIELNPAEAFVLGSAFLIHDLGMALESYPHGILDLQADPAWSDTLISLLFAQLGRRPEREEVELAPADVEMSAIGLLLRERHAAQSERLIGDSYVNSSGDPTFLLEDSDLRRAFAREIGRVARSHGDPVSQLRNEVGVVPLGSAAELGHPAEWTVDRLKLACLIRLADAIHLDGSRAPHFLRVIRNPAGVSSDHWAFQQKLRYPRIAHEELVFTSCSPFTVDEASAWWMCADALRLADDELRQVHALRSSLDQNSFAARGVQGARDTELLRTLVEPLGWLPVDAKVRITETAGLIRKLGGEQLYGNDTSVPLRELIQNARDAVHLRRVIYGDVEWGDIVVRTGVDTHGVWLEVEDDGIGMLPEVLTGSLLDFGVSHWETPLMRREFPNALARGFEPTGKYGIGFFSTFMWGDKVRVTSNRYQEAARDTHVLEFLGGLTQRALLRKGTGDELIENGGTRVRVWFRQPLRGTEAVNEIIHGPPPIHSGTLAAKVAFVAATLDCNVSLEEGGVSKTLIRANDWISMPGEQLLARVWGFEWGLASEGHKVAVLRAALNLRIVVDTVGRPVGRVCLMPRTFLQSLGLSYPGLIAVGGLYSTYMHHFTGVFVGSSLTASRNVASVSADPTSLREWAKEQVTMCQAFSRDPQELHECAGVIWQLGEDTQQLPVARNNSGWLTFDGIATWAAQFDRVICLTNFSILRVHGGPIELADLEPNVLLVEQSYSPVPDNLLVRNGNWIQTSFGEAVTAIAKGWITPVGRIFHPSMINGSFGVTVARQGGTIVNSFAAIITRPVA